MKQKENTDTTNPQMQAYLRQMDQLINGGSWQGESFRDKLNSITATSFFARPIPNIHCIAEIIWHCTYWKHVLLARFNGDEGYRDRTAPQMNFRPINDLQNEGMQKILADFYLAHDQIIAFLQSKDDAYLHIQNNKGIQMDYFIEGIVQHDIYHLGQIGLIQKILSLQD